MKAVDDVFGLGSASRGSFTEEFATITRDDVYLGF